MAQTFDTLRVGKSYCLINYGDESVFRVMGILPDNEIRVQDLNSLEIFNLSELVEYGKGDDYDLFEIDIN